MKRLKAQGPRLNRAFLGVGLCALCLIASACAARRVALPTDSGVPLPDFSEIHAGVSRACVGVRTMTVELGLSGRAGSQNLRGRVLAGFEQPDSMRLEGIAPFGGPVFILAARGAMATLLLPRDERVVREPRASEILAALTGVRLAPGDLLAMLTGCVEPAPRATSGRRHQNGWISIDLENARLYLEPAADNRQPPWVLRVARSFDWQFEYTAWQGTFPQTVRLRADDGSVELTVTLSQIETNLPIDAAAFTVDVPPGTRELTVAELRQAGPLRDQ